MSGVRNLLAFSIFSFIAYLEIVEKKSKLFCFIMYGLLCLLHFTTIILIILRLVASLPKKLPLRLGIVCVLGWPLFLPIFMYFLELFKEYPSILYLREKVSAYTTILEVFGTAGYEYSTALVRTGALGVIILSLCIVFYNNLTEERIKKANLFILLVSLFTFSSFYFFHLYVRMVDYLIFASPMIIIQALRINSLSRQSVGVALPDKRKFHFLVSLATRFLPQIILIVSLLSFIFYAILYYPHIHLSFQNLALGGRNI